MTAQDDSYSPKLHAAPYPGGGREPTFDVPPASNRGEEDDSDSVARDTGADAPRGGSQAAETPAPQPAPANAELEKLRAEASDYKDRALRAVAELENFRRRAEKEREDVAKYAITNFAREILPVADNLRRALDSQPTLDSDAATPLKAFISGVELTERELLAAFERFGLKKIDPMGQPFDHNFHQAMFELEEPNQPAGTVVQVMQPGYVLKDRLLRPAMVGVSKGGPARAENARAGAANDAYASPSDGEGHTVDTQV